MYRCWLLLPLVMVMLLAPIAHAAPGDEVRVTPHPSVLTSLDRAVVTDGKVYSLDNDAFPPPRSEGDEEVPLQLIDDPPTGRQVVFLNFDGAPLTSGGNDATRNKTRLLTVSSHNYPAMSWGSFGGKDKGMADVLKEVKILYYKYGVEFVTKRPASGDYSMVMIGGTGQNCKGGGSAVGISPLDCKNNDKTDVLFVFGNRLSSAKQVAFVIAHELGHAVGLEHIDNNKGIMYPQLSGNTTGWASGNVSGGSSCGRTTQDADKILTENLGVGEPDKVAPLIWIMRPGDDAVLPGRFTMEVGAVDDFSLASVVIYVDGTKKLTLTASPFVALVEGLSDGEHTLKAEARDLKPNVSTAEIEIEVDSSCTGSGKCDPAGSKAGLGMPCSVGDDCGTGICAEKDGVGYCAALCDTKTKLCPTGTTCQDAGGESACVKGTGFSLDHADGKGCSIASGRTHDLGSALMLTLLGLALFGLGRRRM